LPTKKKKKNANESNIEPNPLLSELLIPTLHVEFNFCTQLHEL